MFFFGRYEHNIDSKGRLTIPSGFRAITPSGVYVTQGFDGNLSAFSIEKFNSIADNIDKLSIADNWVRLLNEFLFGNGAQLEFDSAGRILIPAYLKEEAGINSSVIIVGAGSSFGIWDPERWKKHSEKFKDPQLIAERWNAMGIST